MKGQLKNGREDGITIRTYENGEKQKVLYKDGNFIKSHDRHSYFDEAVAVGRTFTENERD